MLQIKNIVINRPESDWHLINGNNFGFGLQSHITHVLGRTAPLLKIKIIENERIK